MRLFKWLRNEVKDIHLHMPWHEKVGYMAFFMITPFLLYCFTKINNYRYAHPELTETQLMWDNWDLKWW